MNRKRDQYRSEIELYQNKHKEAEEKKILVIRRQDDWHTQKKEIKEQFRLREHQMKKKYEEESKQIDRDMECITHEKDSELILLKKRIKGLEADNNKLEKNIARLNEEKQVAYDLEKGEVSKTEMIQRLKDKLTVVNQNTLTRENEITQMSFGVDDLSRAQHESQSLSNEIGQLDTDKTRLHKKYEEQKIYHCELESRLSGLKSEISDKMKENTVEMNRQIRELQEEINRQSEIDNGLKLELGKMCKQVEDEERKTREYMGGRMDEWERKLSDKGIEILEIKKRIHSLAMR